MGTFIRFNASAKRSSASWKRLVGWFWTKHHILLGPKCLVELSTCSEDVQGEGETANPPPAAEKRFAERLRARPPLTC